MNRIHINCWIIKLTISKYPMFSITTTPNSVNEFNSTPG